LPPVSNSIGVIQHSQPIVALVVAVALFLLGRIIIQKVAFAEGDAWLVRVLTIGLVLHLLAAPAQIYIVSHVYHGITDWNRYVLQAGPLSTNFRHFDFSTNGVYIKQIVNDGSVGIAGGIVMAVVGINQLALFLVFGFTSFLGAVCFFRAFTLTFPRADHRRYALMLFLLPSLIYWTADLSKESLMVLAFGLLAYGAAKFLARVRGGLLLVVPGTFIAAYVRPNELLIVVAAFIVAMMIPTAATRKAFGGVRRLLGLVFLGVLLVLSISVTLHYLSGGAGGSLSLQQTNANNQGTGNGFGSSGVPYSSNLLTFPRDIYEMLFNPLPFNAHGSGEYIAALENTVLLGLILLSLRNLRILPRASFARPYVMLCLVFTGIFIYTFAALGNLGLIDRERVVMLPFLLVLLCIPRAPRGSPHRYEWELTRRVRIRRRQMLERIAATRRFAAYRAGPPASEGPKPDMAGSYPPNV
jgi:hypothetical protein